MNNLKFDRARFDAGEMPTRTRDGRKVLWVADSGLDIDYPILAVVETDGSAEYSRDGFLWAHGEESSWDLVHEPKTRKIQVAVLLNTTASWTYATTSDQHSDFESFVERMSKTGRLLQVVEIEVQK